jgi:UDP-N-acetylenolpyruvoylglucosamine reductase
VVRVDVQTG